MTAAAWVTALAGLFTATVNGIAWIRHGRRDEARFADHGMRLERLENGHAAGMPGPVTGDGT